MVGRPCCGRSPTESHAPTEGLPSTPEQVFQRSSRKAGDAMTTFNLGCAGRRIAVVTTALTTTLLACVSSTPAAEPAKPWNVGTPMVTYWAGPSMTDAVAKQMAEGGFNVVWCSETPAERSRYASGHARIGDR